MPLSRKQVADTKDWTRTPADHIARAHGCWFDTAAAEHVEKFFHDYLHHSTGQWAGKPFTLLHWQAEEVIKPLFGWKRADGTRRYRTAYIEVPKKQGKTTMCAGIALYLLIADGEPAAEVYCVARTHDQAGAIYRESARMVDASSLLKRHVDRSDSIKHMAMPKTNSFYRVLSSEASSAEGVNASGIVFDEFHVQPDDRLWNTLKYAGAARRQPLTVIITTAGDDVDSLCYDFHQRTMDIEQGTIEDDAFFGYVRSAERAMGDMTPEQADAFCRTEEAWRLANPSIDETMNLETFAEECRQAMQSPRTASVFKRYRLNIWHHGAGGWLSLPHWNACADHYTEDALAGEQCIIGVDLASTDDFTAVVAWFPERKAILPYFWCPETRIRWRETHGEGHYTDWVRGGYMRTCPGDAQDHRLIIEHILTMSERYKVRAVGCDPHMASSLFGALEEKGIQAVRVPPNFKDLGPGAHDLERRILNHDIRHNGHPVMTFCIGNVVAKLHPEGAIMPSKRQSKRKIDGVTSLVIALSTWLGIKPEEPEFQSVYETRGILHLGT